MSALMRRFGGHPYERGDMIDFKALDPSKPMWENMAALGYNNNELVGRCAALLRTRAVTHVNTCCCSRACVACARG